MRMLEEWERRELWAIELELNADEGLARLMSGPTDRQLWVLAARRAFYPAGYLACAVTYMLFSISGTQLATLAGAALTGVAAFLARLVRGGMSGVAFETYPPGPGA